jgi:outer membrane receptor protein involved in Fe transport
VGSGFTQDVAQIQRQEIELQNTNLLGANNRAVWGGGIRYEYVDQPLIFKIQKGLHQSRLFAHDEWRATEKAVLNMGAMYEDDGIGHRNVSPRLAINYHLDQQNTLRASLSSATRNPVMAELYLQTAKQTYWSNGYTPAAVDVRPEKIMSREIGYLGQFGAFSMDGRIYYDKVRDMVMLDVAVNGNPANPTYSFKNMMEATFKGLDLSATYRWDSGKVSANYSYQQTSCGFGSYPTQYFNPSPTSSTMTLGQYLAQAYQIDYLNICSQSVPTGSGNLLLNQQLSETVQYSIGAYLRGKVRVNDVSSNYPPESPMRRVDMRIASAFGKKDKPGGGEISLVLQNAFQDNYTGYGNVAQRVGLIFNRRAYITTTYNF